MISKITRSNGVLNFHDDGSVSYLSDKNRDQFYSGNKVTNDVPKEDERDSLMKKLQQIITFGFYIK